MRPLPHCGDPDIRSIVETWHTVTPSALVERRQGVSAATTERLTNTLGTTFVNVVVGELDDDECACCDTFSFQEGENSVQLVSFVATRRVRSAADATALAERIWAATEKPLRFEPSHLRERYVVDGIIRSTDSRTYPAELLILHDTEARRYVVRVHLGVAATSNTATPPPREMLSVLSCP